MKPTSGTFYHNRYNGVTVEGVQGQKGPSVKCTLRPREAWIPISVPSIIDLESFH
jgi:hypothetical protein